MYTRDDLTGRRFGRWQVIQKASESGQTKWLCRCDCGTERIVLARSLKSGASLSCGCLNREVVRSRARNLKGQQFGELTVSERVYITGSDAVYWQCICSCGNECIVSSNRLVSGKKTHCGCKPRQSVRRQDITGQKYRMLTALYPTPARDQKKGSVIWHCRCDCGKEVDISLETLKYSTIVSCGCQREKCNQNLPKHLTHIACTSIDILRSKKVRSDNKSGHPGIYRIENGRFRAEITFQRKRYYLGKYDTMEEALYVRRQAEETLHDRFMEFYIKWKQFAETYPEWAKENPISIRVERNSHGELTTTMLPEFTISNY